MRRITAILITLAFGCTNPEHRDVTEDSGGGSAERPSVAVSPVSDAAPAHPVQPVEPYSVGGDVKAPEVLERVAPKYPELDPKKRYVLGLLVLEVVVGSSGTVADAKLVSGPTGPSADAAIEAIRQWKFKPGTLHGSPVPVRYYLTQHHVPVEEAQR